MKEPQWKLALFQKIKGFGKFPSGRNIGSGVMTQYHDGVVDASYQGTIMTAEGGDQFIWWAHEKSTLEVGGKINEIVIVSGFTESEKLSLMNRLIMILESEFDPAAQQFRTTAYEWR